MGITICLVKSAMFNDHMLHALHMLNIKKVIRLYYNPTYLKILLSMHNSEIQKRISKEAKMEKHHKIHMLWFIYWIHLP